MCYILKVKFSQRSNEGRNKTKIDEKWRGTKIEWKYKKRSDPFAEYKIEMIFKQVNWSYIQKQRKHDN